MTIPPRKWRLACLLLFIAIGAAAPAIADSPPWADEEMLVTWPAALSGMTPGTVEPEPTPDIGRASISDQDDDLTAPAESQKTPAELTPPPVSPVSLQSHTPISYPAPCANCVGWHVLPAGILYESYIAGEKEPRMAAALLSEQDRGSVFEATIGGRLGFLRYGTPGPFHPQGFQWDLEGAAMLRQDPEQELDVEATDFRVGSVLTWRRGPSAVKAGYYHLSSHLGDEFLIRNPGFPRLNYVRDALLIGIRHNLQEDLEVYGEIAYAVRTDGGAEPFELQFGLEYTPIEATDRLGAPVLAVNGHLREEFDFGGSVNVIAGWEWRGPQSNRRLRIGGQYYNGKEIQWSFFNESVNFTGVGIWYDF